MGRPDYIFGQFWEIARCATRGRGLLCFSTTACFILSRWSLLTVNNWRHFDEKPIGVIQKNAECYLSVIRCDSGGVRDCRMKDNIWLAVATKIGADGIIFRCSAALILQDTDTNFLSCCKPGAVYLNYEPQVRQWLRSFYVTIPCGTLRCLRTSCVSLEIGLYCRNAAPLRPMQRRSWLSATFIAMAVNHAVNKYAPLCLIITSTIEFVHSSRSLYIFVCLWAGLGMTVVVTKFW